MDHPGVARTGAHPREDLLHGTSGVCLPVAILVGPIRPRAIKDCVGDLLAGVPGHSHPNRDIGIPAARSSRPQSTASFFGMVRRGVKAGETETATRESVPSGRFSVGVEGIEPSASTV
jgi:hypothetical protein